MTYTRTNIDSPGAAACANGRSPAAQADLRAHLGGVAPGVGPRPKDGSSRTTPSRGYDTIEMPRDPTASFGVDREGPGRAPAPGDAGCDPIQQAIRECPNLGLLLEACGLGPGGLSTDDLTKIREMIDKRLGPACTPQAPPTEVVARVVAFLEQRATRGWFLDGGSVPIEDFMTALQATLDPEDLVGRFMRGEVKGEDLTGPEGQARMVRIQTIMQTYQAMLTTLTNLMSAFNQVGQSIAQNMGR